MTEKPYFQNKYSAIHINTAAIHNVYDFRFFNPKPFGSSEMIAIALGEHIILAK